MDRAITASGGLFDEPIGSACGMPQGGYRKPPARLVVMTEFKKSEKFLMLIGYFLLLYTERYSFGAIPYVFLNNLLKYSGLLIPIE